MPDAEDIDLMGPSKRQSVETLPPGAHMVEKHVVTKSDSNKMKEDREEKGKYKTPVDRCYPDRVMKKADY